MHNYVHRHTTNGPLVKQQLTDDKTVIPITTGPADGNLWRARPNKSLLPRTPLTLPACLVFFMGGRREWLGAGRKEGGGGGGSEKG